MDSSKTKHRVMFFHALFPSGGGERVTRDIARSIYDSEYESYVVTCQKNKNIFHEVKVIELPNKHLQSIDNANAIIELIRSLSIDIFVLPGFLWDHLEYVKEQVECKFIYILHNIPLWEIVAKVERRKRFQGSFLRMLEWYFLAYPKIKWFKTYDKKYMQSYRSTYESVDAYVVLCEKYKDEMMNLLNMSDPGKLIVINNAENIVDTSQFTKKKQILFVGNMTYENKRVDRLLRIWNLIYKKLPDWELILVGGGEEKHNLQKLSSKMQLERARFVGGSQDVEPYYRSASVFCLTSTFEGWPLCLTEAQAHGVVPIAFNCCAGVEEILSPSGVNGILVPPFDLEAFADELHDLLVSPEKISQMRDNVVAKSQNYSLDIIGKKWVDLFSSLIIK